MSVESGANGFNLLAVQQETAGLSLSSQNLDPKKGIHARSPGAVYYEGYPADNMFYVHSGIVFLTTYPEVVTGRRIVEIARPGSFIGGETIYPERKYSTSAEIYQDSSLQIFSREDLEEFAKTDPAFLLTIFQATLNLQSKIATHLKETVNLPMEKRVLHALYEFTDPNTDICNATDKILAERAGTTRVTVNKTLGSLRKTGYVASLGRGKQINRDAKLPIQFK